MHVLSYDYNGDPMLMASVTRGGTFGESVCYLGRDVGLFIRAETDCSVLWLDPARLHAVPGTDGAPHTFRDPGGFPQTAVRSGECPSVHRDPGGFPQTAVRSGEYSSVRRDPGGFPQTAVRSGECPSVHRDPGGFPQTAVRSEECSSVHRDPGGFPQTAVRSGGCFPAFCDSGGFSPRLAAVLTERFTAMLAARTLTMNDRIQILSKIGIREKLVTFFSQCVRNAEGDSFTVPFNREMMAVYLGVNRSALSRELCRMRNEGLIEFERTRFRILSKK